MGAWHSFVAALVEELGACLLLQQYGRLGACYLVVASTPSACSQPFGWCLLSLYAVQTGSTVMLGWSDYDRCNHGCTDYHLAALWLVLLVP